MLVGEDLSVSFGSVRAVDNVSFSCKKNQVTSLIGPNGAGKTSLFNLISGIIKPDEGTVIFNNKDVTDVDMEEKAKIGIGRMFQDPHCFSGLTIFENVAMGALRKKKFLQKGKSLNKLTLEKVDYYLEEVGLKDKRKELANSLTFGERRLMNIAQLLSAEMDLFLLDEPAVGLDEKSIEKIGEIIYNLTRTHHKTVLLIEHHYDLVTSISDKVLFMVQGSMVASGKVEEIEKTNDLRKLYLG
ncbi:ABC transporter ATP-binding protein [Bacillus sp. Marseille-P3661]|uniref:ABC transporter ATP-binding protein n=1 Tax=Bacillus sp. Marseille-P3661 TaxID=1936234 RepID=UPI000C847D37|nr:ATP-binding cassette domain-containing protein [Bacillus sp. Marseille-P3661]